MISIYDNYLEDNKDLMDVISNIFEGKKQKLGPDEVFVVKGKKEEVIDVDDLRDYLKKGWELHEATLTKNQQDMVKDIVDNDLDLEEFEKKYGKKEGKGVAFAVATNMVKKKEGITEEELDEIKKSSTGYEIYHKSFSAAMQHAYEYAEKKGYTVDPNEIDYKVALGPRKPSVGKTNRYNLKAGKKTAHIQVYNMNNKTYEFNMYIEGKDTESTPHLMGDSHWEASDELVNYLRNLTPGENPETELDEDAKMAKKSDDALISMLHQMLGQDQSRPTTQHQLKRIREELKKRGLKEDSNELDEAHGKNIDHLRDIISGKKANTLKFSDGTMKVDLFSASGIVQVYDKVNKMNQDNLDKMVNGSKKDFIKAQEIAFKLINKSKK